MRVLLASPGYPPAPGGVERHVAAVAGALQRLGHRVTVVALDAAADRTGPARTENGVRVVRVRARAVGPFLLSRDLVPTLARLAAVHDVVHAHNYHSPVPLAALAPAVFAAGRPVVVTAHFHGGGHTPAARLAHPLYRAAFERRAAALSAVVCVSVAERERFAAAFPGLAGRAVVVPNAPRLPATMIPRQAAAAVPLIACVSRLESYKRVDVLLEALAGVPGLWQAVVVGTGPQDGALRRRAAALGLGSRVRFLGAVDDTTLDVVLARATLVVQPSSREAFGMAVLDAVAAGTPVLASDLPAHREVAALAGGGVTLWPAHEGPAALAALVTEHLVAGPVAAPASPRGSLPSWDLAARMLQDVYAGAVAPARGLSR